MVVCVEPPTRKPRQHRKPANYFPVRYACGSLYGLPVANEDPYRNTLVLVCRSEEQIPLI
jgi:hypothetical protein